MANRIKIDNADLKRRRYTKPKRSNKSIICNILIVCEGKQTEPNYFEAFNKIQRGTVVYNIVAKGVGRNTVGVVEKAIALRDARKDFYDSVWAVFDKDDFSAERFDNAIHKATAHNIECAWSNEACELWYLLHFDCQNTPLGRDKYKEMISDAVNNSPLYKKKDKYMYDKSASDHYTIMNIYGNQSNAITNAQSLVAKFENSKFHSHNPCTMVHKLVLQLIGEDEAFNKLIENKMNEIL